MTMLEEICAVAAAFLGEPVEQTALQICCKAAEGSLCSRLRQGISPQDCYDAFVPAAAWLALCQLGTARQADGVTQFSVGDVSVSKQGQQLRHLRDQAEVLMAPYLKDGFAFRGVRS